MQPLRIFICWDSREDIAYQVCKRSLELHSSIPLEISPIRQLELRRNGGVLTRPGQAVLNRIQLPPFFDTVPRRLSRLGRIRPIAIFYSAKMSLGSWTIATQPRLCTVCSTTIGRRRPPRWTASYRPSIRVRTDPASC
jgi:hypothetical protein